MAKTKTSITTENRSGSAADAAAKEQRTEMPLSDLHPFEGHPFKVLDDELMEQTVESIKQIGVVSPLIVRPDPEGGFEILSGHRRLHAAQLAGLETVPVIVINPYQVICVDCFGWLNQACANRDERPPTKQIATG